ncbi:MAG: VCBS repeat-containing protein [Nitrospirae bacterium]|nr:VCBS repeat-containing protein [Nitrospirota bacterium]MBF0592575.1 VCBS repeat-containing protein [Nitrospirota bacterium]
MFNLKKSVFFAMLLVCLLAFVANGNEAFAKVAGKNIQDINGDSKSDILYTPAGSLNPTVWFMDGTQIFLNPAPVSITGGTVPDATWFYVGTGDFNADGQFDLLYRNRVTSQFMVLTMNGSAVTAVSPAGAAANVIDSSWQVRGIADFDGDGQSELLLQISTGRDNLTNYTVAIAKFASNGLTIASLTNVVTLDNDDWKILGTGNFTGSSTGKSDILLMNTNPASAYAGNVVIWVMSGTSITSVVNVASIGATGLTNWQFIGQVTATTDNGIGVTSYVLNSTGDFDGNGFDDIAWVDTSATATNGQIYIWKMKAPTGSFSGSYLTDQWGVKKVLPSVVTFTPGGIGTLTFDTFVGIYDFDGDGRADILLQSSKTAGGTYPIEQWFIRGTNITSDTVPTAPPVMLMRGVQERCSKSAVNPHDWQNCNY